MSASLKCYKTVLTNNLRHSKDKSKPLSQLLVCLCYSYGQHSGCCICYDFARQL